MKTVAIIAEYNPFHNGHLYQIEKIREEFGKDTAIIAIMSGNYVQRGEMAILDKWERAKAAVLCGVNLVIELPFPYSISSAEFFAKGAVSILNSLGVVDILSFGSECANIDELTEQAKNMLRPEFTSLVLELSRSEKYSDLGYAKITEIAYKKIYSKDAIESLPNNILAIEYIKALISLDSKITPHTIKRLGADYNEASLIPGTTQSATALRDAINSSLEGIKEFVPEDAYNVYYDSKMRGRIPVNQNIISSAILSHLRLNPYADECNIHDAAGGLYNRLVAKAFDATSISSLIDISSTKKFTVARTKRAIWYSYFGVTSSDIRATPLYTQVLGMDKFGQALLKKIKKDGSISVLTKPSEKASNEGLTRQLTLSRYADYLFEGATPIPSPASSVYKRGPFVKDKICAKN